MSVFDTIMGWTVADSVMATSPGWLLRVPLTKGQGIITQIENLQCIHIPITLCQSKSATLSNMTVPAKTSGSLICFASPFSLWTVHVVQSPSPPFTVILLTLATLSHRLLSLIIPQKTNYLFHITPSIVNHPSSPPLLYLRPPISIRSSVIVSSPCTHATSFLPC